MLLARALVAPLVLLVAPACVSSDHDLDEITQATTRTFSGYTPNAGRVITIKALDQSTGQWHTIGSGLPSPQADIPAGVWASNPPLHTWSIAATFARPGDPSGLCFLSADCRARIGELGTSTVRVRFEEGTSAQPQRLVVFDPNWDTCMGERTARGETFDAAAYACRAPSYPELRLRLIEDWARLPARGPSGAPTAGNLAGTQMVAASGGASIAYARSAVVGQWSGWISVPGGPAAGFRTDVAPAFVHRTGEVRDLFAIGNDGLVYRAVFDPIVGQFSAMAALPGISGASGRLSVRWRQGRFILGCAVGPSSVQVTTFTEAGVLSESFVLPGQEIILGDDTFPFTTNTPITIREAAGISVWNYELPHPPHAPLFRATIPVDGVEDFTAVSTDFMTGRLFVARRTPEGTGEIADLAIPRALPGPQLPFVARSRVVASYPLGAQPAQIIGSTGVVVWRDARPGLRAAHLTADDAWHVQDLGGTATLTGRPHLGHTGIGGPFDAVPAPSYARIWRIAASGSDLRQRYLRLDAVTHRRDLERTFDIFSTAAASGCGSANNVVDPVWRPDLSAHEEGAYGNLHDILTEIPPDLVDGALRSEARRMCAAGNRQPATGSRACELARYPVVLSNTTAPYTFADGLYIPRGLDSAGFDLLLRAAIARGLGFHSSGAQPVQRDADATGLPLSVLTEGADLFAEGLGTVCNGRCPGFVARESTSGRELAFAHAIDLYVSNGAGFRATALVDLQAPVCNDLLARKYDWLKTHVYRGFEHYDGFFGGPPTGPLGRCP